MLFNSFEFFAFFGIFLLIFFGLPRRAQPIVLLTASYVFYMGWRPAYAVLLFFTTCVDYITARIIDGSETPAVRRAALISALTINVGILATLKYLDFFLTNVVGLAGLFGAHLSPFMLHLVLPVGISFYTFQSIGYTLDVYNRRCIAERSFLTYAQYVSFFPQLVAGPIERAPHLMQQFHRFHFLRPENIGLGLWLIGFGLFKKMCLADLVSPFVKAVFSAPAQFDGAYNIVATVLFAVQIYCDFSGYSTIARGVARIMDFDLMVNFRQPYLATSLTDFWRRWHISLSSWFRDYLYFPLGGNRVSKAAWARNMMIVFVVSGVWHGAAWTFVVWGALHGAGLLIERFGQESLGFVRILQRALGPTGRYAGWAWTMVIVLAGWVFFRAESIGGAFDVFKSLRHIGTLQYGTFKVSGLPSFELVLLAVFLGVLALSDYLVSARQDVLERIRASKWLSVPAAVLLLYVILIFGVFGHLDFIYFQF